MIPCKSCGRNADFCGCAERRRQRIMLAAIIGTWFAIGFLASTLFHLL